MTCLHPRAWFYRAGWSTSAGRLAVQLVERCQECGADIREAAGQPAPTVLEVRKAGLELWALDADPWAKPKAKRGSGNRR